MVITVKMLGKTLLVIHYGSGSKFQKSTVASWADCLMFLVFLQGYLFH